MAQLIVGKVRDDGDYDTIAAIQNDSEGKIPSIEWILQIKEHLEYIYNGEEFVILHREELVDVIVDDDAVDVSSLCEEVFSGGKSWL